MKGSLILNFAAVLLTVCGLAGCKPAQESGKEKAQEPAKPSTNGHEHVADEDLKKMQGVWTLASGESDGKPLPEDVVKVAKLTIEGDKYTVELGEMGVKKGTQHINSTKSPKQIDAHDTSGPTTGENLGIYEFTADGDFRVCFAATGKERPTEFATKPDTGTFIHVWRRAKPQ